MIAKEFIKTNWGASNKKHLLSKGYVFTNMGDSVDVLMEDLSPKSPQKVKVYCDKCKRVFFRQRRKLKEKHYCINCSAKDRVESRRKKCTCGEYIDRPSDNDKCKRCRLTQYTRNDYEFIDEDTVKLILRDKKNKINGYTLIDFKNLERVKKYKWRISTGNYILGGEDNHTRLHRFIMNCPNDKEIDHVNRLTIDNRECNLKVVTRKENLLNRKSLGEQRYSDVKYNDVGNGTGVRISFWTQGCDIRCKGCHNSKIWKFEDGKPYTQIVTKNIVKNINKNGLDRGLSILGGEPFHPKNIDVTLDVLINVKRHSPETNIWLWTGYKWEDLIKNIKIKFALGYLDIIVDGRFEEDKKDLNLKHRGSSNQRIIDVQESLKCKEVILFERS